MKLVKFKITNFKSVEDSGEVDINDFTVLVGKNESGKTNILRALHKFNNALDERYSQLREYPRTRFHEYNETDPVTHLTFELSNDEKNDLREMGIEGITHLLMTRKYDYQLNITAFGDEGARLIIPGKLLLDTVENFNSTIQNLDFSDNQTENLLPDKERLISFATKISEGVLPDQELFNRDNTIKARINSLSSTIVSEFDNGDLKASIESAFKELKALGDLIAKSTEYIFKQIPVFIYFENYAMLDSRIHLPSFLQRKTSGSMTPADKTANTMFELTKLNIRRVVDLGKIVRPDFGGNQSRLEQYRKDKTAEIQAAIDEITILVDRASLSLSRELRKLWSQRENRPSFDVYGDFLRLWVSDEETGAKIELEERSKGFQWFLSFYIVFMVESELGHRNAILLLDEPGLHLHASAQHDLIRVLHDLAEKNQIIYTTHSPFMIDTDDLGSIHIVQVKDEFGTKISNKTWWTDKDALFPLQSALGYSLTQSLFVGKNILLVEGLSDYWIINSLSNYLRDSGRIGLDADLIITPAGGAQKMAYLASLLVSQELHVTILADFDSAGKKLFEDLVKTKIIKEKHLVFVNEVVDNSEEMSIEDLFPEEYYLSIVNQCYTKELDGKELTSFSTQHPLITHRIAIEFNKFGLEFQKTRPARVLLDEFSKLDSQIPELVLERFEALFKIINTRRPTKNKIVQES